jgi:hypothetical protein
MTGAIRFGFNKVEGIGNEEMSWWRCYQISSGDGVEGMAQLPSWIIYVAQSGHRKHSFFTEVWNKMSTYMNVTHIS